MAENVDDIALEDLIPIREDMRAVKGKPDDPETGRRALRGMLFGLPGYVRGIDVRGEHIDRKLGIDT